jgi:hypothetical protein
MGSCSSQSHNSIRPSQQSLANMATTEAKASTTLPATYRAVQITTPGKMTVSPSFVSFIHLLTSLLHVDHWAMINR